MTPDLVVIVPTRSRPDNLSRLFRAFNETCEAHTYLCAVVDADDPALGAYVSKNIHPGLAHQVLINDNTTMVEALNYGASHWVDRVPYIGFMGDDHIPKTKGWDEAFLDRLEGFKAGMVFGNDLLQGSNIPTHIVMSSNIPRALGHVAWPEFKHMYVDNYWKELAAPLGILYYISKVVIEHYHPFAGKGQLDEGYNRVNSAPVVKHDHAKLLEWRRLHSYREVGLLRELL